ncbi:MAG: menC [Actinomycetia bacterium]|nr:menC [Actinomycetes bacterium]
MKLEAVELRRVSIPLREPWRTAHGVLYERDVLLVRALTDGAEGWGECGALSEPGYSPEWVDGAAEVLRRWLVPGVVGTDVNAEDVGPRCASIPGHQMAKAALETAVLDAELRNAGLSLAAFLGATRNRVPAGVAVGFIEPLPALLATVERFVTEGYARVKLKIAPGHDLGIVGAVRKRFPHIALQVDANGAYSPDEMDALVALDPFDLLLLEQPFPPDDLLAHAALARRARTPVCLDESIVSADSARVALALGACSVVNIKAPRVGGVLEARRIHDLCVAADVPVWCGGMLETGIGRALNVALAALPGFTLPGDLSASDRYYERDLTEPFVLDDGCLNVPTGAGIGVVPNADVLLELTTSVETITAD